MGQTRTTLVMIILTSGLLTEVRKSVQLGGGARMVDGLAVVLIGRLELSVP